MISCANNTKHLGLAMQMYAMDYNDTFTAQIMPQRFSSSQSWTLNP